MIFRCKCTSWLAVATLALTLVWIVMMVLSEAYYGPLDEISRILAYYRGSPAIFTAIYLACGGLTLVTLLWFAALFEEFRQAHPMAATLGIAMAPVYATLNGVVYFSQVAVVAELARSADIPDPVLVQLVQLEPSSMMAFVNVFAYAVLGVPSGFFGYLAYRKAPQLRFSGFCLAASGIGSWLSVLGMVVGVPALRSGVVIGGVLFLLALLTFVWGTRRDLVGSAVA